jgi:hypothetical protein
MTLDHCVTQYESLGRGSDDQDRHCARDDRMTFVGMSLREAIEAFTQAAYGERLTFDHA